LMYDFEPTLENIQKDNAKETKVLFQNLLFI
jgi:hypothetical protein